MNILGTKMTNAMIKREGYLTISDVADNSFKSYTFNSCLKVKEGGFVKWILYWEDCPVVYIFTVLTTELSTGYVKATIIDKECTFVDVVGEYPSKTNITLDGSLVKGKFVTQKIINQLAQEQFLSKPVDNTVKKDLQNKVKHNKITNNDNGLRDIVSKIEQAWGIKSKK